MMLTRSLKYSLWSFYHAIKKKTRGRKKKQKKEGDQKKNCLAKTITQAMLLGPYDSHFK